MPYNVLLNRIVAESGYTAKQIVEECENKGVHIDKTYFSKIQNGRIGAPREEISIAIAEMCNADARKLVLEGYLDKAPKQVKEFLLTIKNILISSSLQILNSAYDENTIKELQIQLEKEPLSDYIIEYLNNVNSFKNINQNMFNTQINQNDMNIMLTEPIGISVPDNSMFPLIQEKAKVCLKLEEKYNNGDILVIKPKNKDELLIRYALINDNEIILTPLNKDYKKLTYNLDDIVIMGKVIKVITEI